MGPDTNLFLVRLKDIYFFSDWGPESRPLATVTPSLGRFMNHEDAIDVVKTLHRIGYPDACVATAEGKAAGRYDVEIAEETAWQRWKATNKLDQ